MSTVQLEYLWQYIQSLGLSKKNRQWLADKLVAPVAETEEKIAGKKTEYQLAWEDAEEGRVSEPFTTSDELFNHLGI